MLIPVTCPVCGDRGRAPCDGCRALLRRAPALPCPTGVDRCAAVLDYDGAGRELVARLKYRNARAALPFLATAMAALVERSQLDLVTWVPTTPARRRSRGFDHAELLARAVARRLRLPCRPALRRRPGPAQTGLDAAERRAGPVFHVFTGSRLPARVLLVDDVVTTGATVRAAAAALRGAGTGEVHVLAAARTRPGRRAVGPAGSGVHSAVAVCGSVVESRGQPQAKRPT
ncbi:MAG: ComF family protein [Acidimicrobiales bacterium]